MVSPICLVNSQSTLNGVDVTGGQVIVIQLQDRTGVDNWSCLCTSTDELQDKDVVNLGVVIDNDLRTATFTMPTETTGVSLIFESKVNNGLVNGVRTPALSNRIKICTLSSATNARVMAADETIEGNITFGWITVTNNPIRYGGGGGGGGTPSGPAGGDLSGTYPNPTVRDLTITSEQQGSILIRNATNWVQLAPSTDGYVLTTHGTSANPTWASASSAPTGAAGGDLTGTYPNPSIGALKVFDGNVATFAGIQIAKLATIAPLSVMGNAGAGITNPAVIEANSDGQVLTRVSNSSLAFATLGATSITNNAITLAKLATITTDSLLGRDTAGTGNVEVITLDTTIVMNGSQVLGRAAISGDVTISAGSNSATVTDLTIASEAQGDILYRNASNWVRLAAGTDGYVLTTHGAAANPTWASGGGGGAPSGPAGGVLGGTYPNPSMATNAVVTVNITDANVTLAKIANGTALSVLGRSANSSGVYADMAAATDGNIMRRSGTTIGFGSIDLAAAGAVGSSLLPFANIASLAGLSVFGRSANTTGVMAAITGTDGQALRVSGTALGFGTLATAAYADASVTLAKLANITTDSLIGRDTTGTGVPEVITLDTTIVMNGSQVLGRAGISGDITIAAGSNTAAITALSIVDGDISASANIAISKLANGTALSVMGNATNATAAHTDIVGTNGQALRVSGTTLGFGTLTSSAYADNSVTLVKIETITTDSLLGRDTASTGNVEIITLGSSLSMNGTKVLQRAALTGDVTASVDSNTTAIASGVVSMAKLADLAGISLIGRSANTTGVPAAITATTTGQIPIYNGTNVSFGSPNFGALTITTTGIVSLGTTPASAGDMRIKHNWTMSGRNQAGSADNDIIRYGVTGNNVLRLGNGGTGFDTQLAGDNLYVAANIAFDAYVNNSAVIHSDTTNGTTVGDGYYMVEAVNFSGRRIVSLGRASATAITTTQMPSNTGDGVIYIGNAQTLPSADPVSGGILFSSGGALFWRGSSGTITQLALS